MAKKAKKTAEEYSRQELYALAEKRGVKYRSRMNKEQLFDALGLGGARPKPFAGASARRPAAAASPARQASPAKTRPAAAAPVKAPARIPPSPAARTSAPVRPAAPASLPKPTPVQAPVRPNAAPAGKVAPSRPAAAPKAATPPAPVRPALAARADVRPAPAPAVRPAALAKPTVKHAAKAVAKPSDKPVVKTAAKPSVPIQIAPAAFVSGMLPPGSVVAPPPPQGGAAFVDRGPELPAGYGDDRIVALVRDPRCVFAYWELDGGGRERLRREIGEGELAGSVWVLRLVMVTGERFFDVPVNPAAGNWYLHVEPGERYQVRIGLVLSSGTFRELAASAEVITPAETVSDVIDEQWMLVREEFDRMVDEILSVRATVGGVGASEMLHRLAVLPRRLELLRGALSSPRGGGQ